MLPASNAGVGMNMGFPDVCVTPMGPVPTPIPYPNMAMNAMAVPFAPNVLISFVPALNMGSVIPMTLGDQAGVLSPFMGPGMYTMGNPVVMVNALPAINLLCPTTGNTMINALGAVMVPSITNVFYSDAAAPPPGQLDRVGLTQLARALEPAATLALAPDGIALATVPVFTSSLPARVYSAVSRWGREHVAALVVDLRGCGGGEVMSAIELAGDFLPAGALVVTATDGDGDETAYRARDGDPYPFLLFLLVDGSTASAAEVFAGALQAHRRAVVLGERTHGKGSAQTLVAGLAEPSAHYATVATFTLPNGEPIEGCGVRPDIQVPSAGALDAARSAIGRLVFNHEVV
jgi:carboxyl-terminal processing protease